MTIHYVCRKQFADLVDAILVRAEMDESVSQVIEETGRNWNYVRKAIDSVPHYSPVVVKFGQFREAQIDVLPIADLYDLFRNKNPSSNIWVFKGYTSRRNSKKSSWSKIKAIVRHPYKGSLLRINAVGGLVDVSPNHSMLSLNGKIVDARTLKKDDCIPIPKFWDNKGETGIFVGNQELAWLYGFFMAEGSANPATHGFSCSIANTDKNLVERAKLAIQDQLNLPTSKVMNDKKRGMFRIAINNKRAWTFFAQKFYTKSNQKRVPREIFNAPKKIKRSFLLGYNDGDGTESTDTATSYASTSQTELAGIATLVALTTRQAFNVFTRKDKPNVIEVHFNKGGEERRCHRKRQEIKKITEVTYDGFLYDIETEDHTFTTGIGPISVHNTAMSKQNVAVQRIMAEFLNCECPIVREEARRK